ncbi:MAG: hypothetical protein AB2L14_25260 [Candidatus Xenobiia bacterium LiM19]
MKMGEIQSVNAGGVSGKVLRDGCSYPIDNVPFTSRGSYGMRVPIGYVRNERQAPIAITKRGGKGWIGKASSSSSITQCWPGPDYDETRNYLFNSNFTGSPSLKATLDCGAYINRNWVILSKGGVTYYVTGITGGNIKVFNVATGATVATLTPDSALVSAEIYLSGNNIVMAARATTTATWTDSRVQNAVNNDHGFITLDVYPDTDTDDYPSEDGICYTQIKTQYISTTDWTLSSVITANHVKSCYKRYQYLNRKWYETGTETLVGEQNVIIYRPYMELDDSSVTKIFGGGSSGDYCAAPPGPTGHTITLSAAISGNSALTRTNPFHNGTKLTLIEYYRGATENFETYVREWGSGFDYTDTYNVWTETMTGYIFFKRLINQDGTITTTTGTMTDSMSNAFTAFSPASQAWLGENTSGGVKTYYFTDLNFSRKWSFATTTSSFNSKFRKNFSNNTDTWIRTYSSSGTVTYYSHSQTDGSVTTTYPNWVDINQQYTYINNGAEIALGTAYSGTHYLKSKRLDEEESSLTWTASIAEGLYYLDNGLAFGSDHAFNLSDGSEAFNYSTVSGASLPAPAGFSGSYLFLRYHDTVNTKDIIYAVG